LLAIIGFILLVLNAHPYRCNSGTGNASPLSPGIAYYEPPKEMVINEPETIIAIISKDINRSGDKIIVSPEIEVNLSGPSEVFSIDPVYPVKKKIDFGDTTWVWYVTPKKSGSYKLMLRIWTIPYNLTEDQSIPRTIRIKKNFWDQFNAGIILLSSGLIALFSIIATLFNNRINNWFDNQGGVLNYIKRKMFILIVLSLIIIIFFVLAYI
jgi:hypothetical protein